MSRIPPTTIYLQSEQGYSRVAKLQEYSHLNMHIYFNGLNSKQAKIIGEFPEKIVRNEELEGTRFNFRDLRLVNIDLEYFSFHNQVPRSFRVKVKNQKAPIELIGEGPLTLGTGLISHISLVTELVQSYSEFVEIPKEPYVLVVPQVSMAAKINFYIYGADFEPSRKLLNEMKAQVILEGLSLKVFINISDIKRLFESSHRGNLVMPIFKLSDGKNLIRPMLIG